MDVNVLKLACHLDHCADHRVLITNVKHETLISFGLGLQQLAPRFLISCGQAFDANESHFIIVFFLNSVHVCSSLKVPQHKHEQVEHILVRRIVLNGLCIVIAGVLARLHASSPATFYCAADLSSNTLLRLVISQCPTT